MWLRNVPFRVQAGSGNNALVLSKWWKRRAWYCQSVLELQITDGDTPGIRLEQDLSGSYPALWDICCQWNKLFIWINQCQCFAFASSKEIPRRSMAIGSVGNVKLDWIQTGFNVKRINQKLERITRVTAESTNAQRTALETILRGLAKWVWLFTTEPTIIYLGWDYLDGALLIQNNQTVMYFN